MTGRIDLRVSQEQKQRWIEYAAEIGISVCDLIRMSVEKEIKNGKAQEIFKKQE